MLVKVITPPASYPISLAEAKAWCRIRASDTSQDGVLDMLIRAMTAHAEHLTGRSFVERTLQASFNYFDYDMVLPYPPLIEIDAISYIDINGVSQDVGPVYEYDASTEPGTVRPLLGYTWPYVSNGIYNPIRIRYKAGYRPPGSPPDYEDRSYLPQELRTWMAARICTLYDNRDHIVIGVSNVTRNTVAAIPREYADALLDSLVVGSRLF